MRDFKAGASASLNKTITDMIDHLQREAKRPTEGLRDCLYELIGDYGESNYRRGFNHRESAKNTKNGKVPNVLRYTKTREFFKDGERTVHLRSRLKKKH